MNNSIICITGGANGLGRELATNFSPHNNVIILDVDSKTKIVADQLACDYQICDVSNFDQLAHAIKKIIFKYKKIDCFINNAGVYIDGAIETNNPKRITKVFEVNCLGQIFATNILVPIFKKHKHGVIININSTAGLHPKGFNSVYHASKAAMTSFSKSIQLELIGFPIKIINIHPGLMNTKFTQGTNINLSKSLHPEEVVKAINFILSLDPRTTIPNLTIKTL